MTESIQITGIPAHTCFAGTDKYLRYQIITISEQSPAISEDDSLLILVQKGQGTIVINGVRFYLHPGTFLWIHSYHTFSIEAFPEQTLELHVLMYDYQLASFLTFYKAKDSEFVSAVIHALPLIQLTDKTFPQIQELYEEFRTQDTCFDPGSALIKVSILGQLSEFFAAHCIHTTQKAAQIKQLGWNVILYMCEYFYKGFNAAEVAEQFGTTVPKLNRELRSISAMDFRQILNKIRVNISASALLYEEIPLSHVAVHSGFPSEVAFYRNFKKYTGMTPLEYRKHTLNREEGVYRNMIMNSSMMEILAYAFHSFSSPMELSAASRDLFLSEGMIRRQVQDQFGISYNEIASRIRLRYAEALLLTTKLPILDIAVNAGFNCSQSFSRSFKKKYGMLPGEYRLANQRR